MSREQVCTNHGTFYKENNKLFPFALLSYLSTWEFKKKDLRNARFFFNSYVFIYLNNALGHVSFPLLMSKINSP